MKYEDLKFDIPPDEIYRQEYVHIFIKLHVLFENNFYLNNKYRLIGKKEFIKIKS